MQTLFICYLVLLALTTIGGLISYKRLTSPFRLLVLMVCYVFYSELLGRILIYSGARNLSPIYHVNALVLILLTALLYWRLFQNQSKMKQLVLIISLICGTIALLNTLLHQSLVSIPSFSIAANAFQSIALSLVLYNDMIKSPSTTPIHKQSIFWLNTGTFIFYSANFVGFILYNEYYQLKGIAPEFLFYLNWSGNMILYTSYLLGFYFNQKHA